MKKYSYQNLEIKNMKGEKWKFIPGAELYFKVSNYGRIKRLEYELRYSDGRLYIKPEKIIKPTIRKTGNTFTNDNLFHLHTRFTLFKRKYNFSLTRLVYYCFLKPFDLHDQSIIILTKDKDSLNVSSSNLKRASRSEKQKRIFETFRREPLFISNESRERAIVNSRLTNNKTVTQYTKDGNKMKTYPSIKAASKTLGISNSHISNCAGGTEYSAGGFIWRYGVAPK